MTLSDFRLIVPPHTPFHADGSINLKAVEKQAALFVENGIDGVFVSGSTGEGQSLSNEESFQMAGRWRELADGTDLEVIVQVGHNSQQDAQAKAAHAQQIGADAVAASSPCYFKPTNVDALIDFLAPVAAAAGDLPFYFYDIPPLTEVRLPMVDFLVRGKQRIPNLVGLKYSNIDLIQMQQCIQLNDGEFEVLYGSDPTLIAGAIMGACGAIGTTYNFAAPLYRRMLAALQRGDLTTARAEQAHSVAMIDLIRRTGGLAGFKAVMEWFGVDCGPVRAPLDNLTVERKNQLRADLEAIGFFQWSQRSAASDSAVADLPTEPAV
ncbi:MAG: dihydrodipicolinate synthase family protein [Pirellulaceae bacterium]|jgi:N-acetylneuraminate lyase|nr:dihydrodipicolinate synthase family protein [Pirellulaceae bacterium]MDP6554099.1 dihydrodipicolinate synthase family protein [Pirellulaceae bacterium]MDP6723518.1 dihydrodipicolinate synthase family protein [Pirellulaceae bacterium]